MENEVVRESFELRIGGGKPPRVIFGDQTEERSYPNEKNIPGRMSILFDPNHDAPRPPQSYEEASGMEPITKEMTIEQWKKIRNAARNGVAIVSGNHDKTPEEVEIEANTMLEQLE